MLVRFPCLKYVLSGVCEMYCDFKGEKRRSCFVVVVVVFPVKLQLDLQEAKDKY